MAVDFFAKKEEADRLEEEERKRSKEEAKAKEKEEPMEAEAGAQAAAVDAPELAEGRGVPVQSDVFMMDTS